MQTYCNPSSGSGLRQLVRCTCSGPLQQNQTALLENWCRKLAPNFEQNIQYHVYTCTGCHKKGIISQANSFGNSCWNNLNISQNQQKQITILLNVLVFVLFSCWAISSQREVILHFGKCLHAVTQTICAEHKFFYLWIRSDNKRMMFSTWIFQFTEPGLVFKIISSKMMQKTFYWGGGTPRLWELQETSSKRQWVRVASILLHTGMHCLAAKLFQIYFNILSWNYSTQRNKTKQKHPDKENQKFTQSQPARRAVCKYGFVDLQWLSSMWRQQWGNCLRRCGPWQQKTSTWTVCGNLSSALSAAGISVRKSPG